MKQKNKKKQQRITVKDYLKAVKKANREIELEQNAGWRSTHKVHQSKKSYNRKANRTIDTEEE